MRNSEFLDSEMPEDDLISDMQKDENGFFKMIDGKKIYQIEELSQRDIDTNIAINRVRASGMSPSEYLKSLYR